MAFEDVYAEVASTSYVDGIIDEVGEDYARPLTKLLPPGMVWEFEPGDDAFELLRAMSYPFFRVKSRGLDLIEEMDPRTTYELLADWERVLDLPGDHPEPATTVADRRTAIHTQLQGHNSPTPDEFAAIAAVHSYSAVVSHKKYSPFVAGSVVGDPLTNHEWAHVWNFITFSGAKDQTVKYDVKKVVPDHTKVQYSILDFQQQTLPGVGAVDMAASAYGGISSRIFVCGGESGTLYSSYFGEDPITGGTWVARTSGFGTYHITKIIWVDDFSLFIAVGTGGKLSTSPDGVTWTARTSTFGAFVAINDIHYDPIIGAAVIVGQSGNIARSTNGTTWNNVVSGFGSSNIISVTSDGTKFVAVGSSGKISTSPIGVTWTARTSGTSSGFLKIAWGDDSNDWLAASRQAFVAITSTKIYRSVDGVTWARTDDTPINYLSDITFGNGLFVLASKLNTPTRPSILASSDYGLTWFSMDIDEALSFVEKIVFCAPLGCFVIQATPTSPTNMVGCIVTPDALRYAYNTIGGGTSGSTGLNYCGDANSGRLFVSRENDVFTAFVASNEACAGYHMIPRTSPSTKVLYDIAVSDTGLFCVVGAQESGTSYIATSVDGVNWTRQTTTETAALWGVCFDATYRRWVAVGQPGAILISDNAITWREPSNKSLTQKINRVASNGSQIIAVANKSGGTTYVSRSVDGGETWVSLTISGFAEDLEAVYYSEARGLWMVAGDAGGVATSTDGLVWADTAQTDITGDIACLLYDDDYDFWLCGVPNDGGQTFKVYKSADDGTTWEMLASIVGVEGPNSIVKTARSSYIAGCGGTRGVRISQNGGDDWYLVPSDGSLISRIYSMALYDNLLIAVGIDTSTNGLVMTATKESEY